MKALILNCGIGNRKVLITKKHSKCMAEISFKNIKLCRQLRMLVSLGVEEVVMTVGALHLLSKYTFA